MSAMLHCGNCGSTLIWAPDEDGDMRCAMCNRVVVEASPPDRSHEFLEALKEGSWITCAKCRRQFETPDRYQRVCDDCFNGGKPKRYCKRCGQVEMTTRALYCEQCTSKSATKMRHLLERVGAAV